MLTIRHVKENFRTFIQFLFIAFREQADISCLFNTSNNTMTFYSASIWCDWYRPPI